jgi:hypothetical protein
MKKLGGVLLILALMIAFVPSRKASAAACDNVSSYGAIRLNVPELNNIKQQALWVRMQAPSANSKILAEINGADCLEIGGEDLGPNEWTWQTWRKSGQVSVINFEKSAGNTIKVIGINDGVKIDRILLTDAFCTPQEYGNNCRTVVELRQSQDLKVTMLPAPSESKISGKVLLTSTPQQNTQNLRAVEYVAEGNIVQRFETPAPFDTTLLANGKYEIGINTILKDGKVIREATVVDIKNAENALSPAVRWVRLNMRSVSIAGVVIGGLLTSITLLNIMKKWHKSRRERKFHGF